MEQRKCSATRLFRAWSLKVVPLLRLPHPPRVLCGRVGLPDRREYSEAFAFPRSSFRFNLDCTFHRRRIVDEAAPRPVLRAGHKSALDRIP